MMFERFALALSLVAALSSAGCIPEMEPAVLCAPNRTLPYPEAPPGSLAQQNERIVAAYVGLAGEWSGQMQCPKDAPYSGPVVLSIRPDPIEQVQVVVGIDESKPGADCHREGAALAGGTISMTGDAIGGLSGETADLHAVINGKASVQFSFDAGYDPSLSAIDGLLEIQPDLSVALMMVFSGVPTRYPDGYTRQYGYTCGLGPITRL